MPLLKKKINLKLKNYLKQNTQFFYLMVKDQCIYCSPTVKRQKAILECFLIKIDSFIYKLNF